ncbi:MAG TPA: preprotein translocase subunit SecA [Candidatus Tectomicrobia bacterium]|nr:preprotein translocase subunit SecA [Candidatus Tectomicrobia bacterium]
MLSWLLPKIIPSKNERELRRIRPLAEAINWLEAGVVGLSDAELSAKTAIFRQRLEQGERLDDLLPEAFAVVREAAKRVLHMRHFDVQLIGGIVLHEGKIAEMATGEGKTLVATLPAYLNALTGRGVHIVTVNDYLARRDTEWMGPIYRWLGLTVGTIQHDMDDAARQRAYQADIVYGTNNEFGFDYLRDHMKFALDDCVQRELHYAIVDEVDSILIDEARTPLIISGPAEQSTELYYRIDRIIPRLKKEDDYTIDEKTRSVVLTEEGVQRVEDLLHVENLYDPHNIEILHHVTQALRAHALFKKDVDYVVKSGEVIIVDEFTGRLMPGRRWSDGLHQAVEAKEKVKIANENQTLATITFQNYFRMYTKLAGMTGTADTEAQEFHTIYNLDVMVIPTNRALIRHNYPDVVYRTEPEKFKAVVDEIAELYAIGRPVLVGTISIEKSERLSRMLRHRGIPHNVLNAKQHEREAEIVAQAGRYQAVTIATNMAGRGTDIVLGGNPEFRSREELRQRGVDPAHVPPEEWQAIYDEIKGETDRERDMVLTAGDIGGLHIIGTERHESRRIDNQLRGRAGRQGDPGSSRFYLSLEDDLLRIFGSDRLSSIMGKLGMVEDEPIEHRMITKAIEGAQRKVEAHNFEIRKHLLEYDDVMNKQREVLYELRTQVLGTDRLKETFLEMLEEVVEGLVAEQLSPNLHPEEWDLAALQEAVKRHFGADVKVQELPRAGADLTSAREFIFERLRQSYDDKEAQMGEPMLRHLERMVMLQLIDTRWKDHLLAMDHLKEGIGLRGYAQKNPLNEYKREAFEIFSAMMTLVKSEITEYLFKVQAGKLEETVQRAEARRPRYIEHRGGGAAGNGEGKPAPVRREGRKIGRNEPCPCGSGKKYKRCCGAA